jgi:hypothetical protein
VGEIFCPQKLKGFLSKNEADLTLRAALYAGKYKKTWVLPTLKM